MISDLYWISTLTYALVLILILGNDIRIKRNPSEVEKNFRLMVKWVLFFCLQDSVWGLCENGILKGDKVFFAASTVFHISTVATTFFWLNYVLSYLGDRIKGKKVCLGVNAAIILFEILLSIINFFTPTLFRIENGVYVVGPLRPLTFVNQFIIYFSLGIGSLVLALNKADKQRKSYLTVCAFALAPIVLGVLQLLYPEAPFYSLGYFLGCFVVHLFIVAKDREASVRGNVLKSVANTYYSMHLVDLEANRIDKFIESEKIGELIGEEVKAQEMIYRAFKGTVTPEYYDQVMEFIDLSTLSKRLGDSNIISFEFIGRFHGWTRISFIPVEKEGDKLTQVMLTTQVIDKEKNEHIDLALKSYTDELTGLYNRRSFETDLEKLKNSENDANLLVVSIDVNGLKVINDTLGHQAGDELLIGAASCMKKSFGAYGRVYRTGGDEFCALLYANKRQADIIIRDIEETTSEWKSEVVGELSVSCGFVRRKENPKASIDDLLIMADQRMYEAKEAHYRKAGVDRRGQKEAHTALCSLYTKILRINLTDDSYQIVNMDLDEQTKEKGFSDKISVWLYEFGKSGSVHEDDLKEYLEKTNPEYLREYFKSGKKSISIYYRRKYADGYKDSVMEMIPTGNYSDDNQTLFLYVKCLDK